MKSDYSRSSRIRNLINIDNSVIEVSNQAKMSSLEERRLTHEVNLAAAFHDHISCTKLPSQICKVGGDINSLISASLNNCSSIDSSTSIFFGASTASFEEKQQVQRLKEMILVQLDLIQHQQEQLLKKDRQLQGLKQDRQALCLRLEKMEKRNNFLTNKLLVTNSDSFSTGESLNKLNETENLNNLDSSEEVANMFDEMYTKGATKNSIEALAQDLQNQDIICDGIIKCESLNDSDNSESTLIIEDPQINEIKVRTEKNQSKKRNRSCKSNEIDNINQESTESCKTDKELCEGLSSKANKRKKISSHKTNVSKKCDYSSDDVNTLKSLSTNLNIIETENPYSLYNCREETSTCLEDDSLLSFDIPLQQSNIEVPSWRYNPITSSSSCEGGENLDDEVFLRRHSKQELDEKRRKRWDIQRLREQRQNERLRLGRYHNNTSVDKPGDSRKKAIDIVSFFSEPKDVQFIEVTDKLPLMAFGLPIPKLPKRPFALPWIRSTRSLKFQSKSNAF